MLSYPVSRHLTRPRSKYFPQHPFSHTLNLCSSLSFREKFYDSVVEVRPIFTAPGADLGERSQHVHEALRFPFVCY